MLMAKTLNISITVPNSAKEYGEVAKTAGKAVGKATLTGLTNVGRRLASAGQVLIGIKQATSKPKQVEVTNSEGTV